MSALSPAVVAAIDDLELAARIIVEGLRTGGHRSPFHGYSTEFRQHRPYRAGDDLKYLDWKLFARSDRLYTRQFRETTNLSVMLALDASASMAFPEQGVSKFRYGQIVAAALAYLVSEQGHAVGLMTMEGNKLAYVPARGGRPHLHALLARIDRLEARGRWDSVRVIDRAAQLLERRGIIVVLSDFYDAEEETRREMRRVAQRGHDIAMLQVISPDERTLPYADQVELEDAESGERRLVDSMSVSEEYRAAMDAFLDRCRMHAQRDGVDYALMSTDVAPEIALRQYLLPAKSRPAGARCSARGAHMINMIWQSPWAWLGLATIALPVIVHLLSRGHARVHRFPTLRFIDASRLLPTRRTRVNDLPLLIVRAAIFFAAAAALAQPLFLTAKRSRAANASLARVVIVDTSGSATSADVNRATQLASDAASSTVLSTDDPASMLSGAVGWLETQAMRGEIAVVSRFPVGSLDSIDIARIPARLGVKLVRIPATSISPFDVRTRSQGETIARVTPSADRTDLEWSAVRAAGASVEPLIVAGAAERDRVNAARAAAATIPVGRRSPAAESIAVVEPGYEGRDTLERNAAEPHAPWMMDVVARLAADSLLAAAARGATIVAPNDSPRMIVVARNDSGHAVVLAAEGSIGGRRRLTLYSLADAGSLTSAALLAAIAHATSLGTTWAAYEPSVISDEVLARWQRAPTAEPRPRPNPTTGSAEGDSDARWLWIVVLVLLGLEAWMRRERRVAIARREAVREHAA